MSDPKPQSLAVPFMSVDEVRPRMMADHLVSYQTPSGAQVAVAQMIPFDDGSHIWQAHHSVTIENVTHWAPLPPPAQV